jgi:thiol-disulfide isomerase/thioredoxin
MYVEKGKVHIPELVDGSWVNSEPIKIKELKNKVVLVDFWDYTCVNCIRTLPYLKVWHNRYKDKGLLIIGVHAPEFVFTGIKSNVEKGIEEFNIEYPVVMDNAYRIWTDFANKFWPAKYIADNKGYIRYAHFGEGNYIETELAIQLLLKEIDSNAQLPDPMKPVRDLDIPGIHCYRVSPELYFGYTRGRIGNSELVEKDKIQNFSKPLVDLPDTIFLEGKWLITSEYTVPVLEDLIGHAKIYLKYTSSEVNLVINPLKATGINAEIRQDGEYLTDKNKGKDIKINSNGSSFIQVNSPRMYNIINNMNVNTHELELSTDSNSFALYAFTFVSCVL